MSGDLVGHKLGPYLLERRLAAGRTCVVYVARHEGLGSEVVLKVLRAEFADDDTRSDRFLRAARAQARLEHLNIVRVIEADRSGEVPFIVEEYLLGDDLEHVLDQRGSLGPDETERIVRQIAAALDHAHANGVVHRDVKPGNIVVSLDGHATLIDFGLARSLEDAKQTSLGQPAGTADYMSPEQWLGEPAVPASDQYGLGAVTFHMLCGRPPFNARSVQHASFAHTDQAPPLVSSLRTGLPRSVDTVIEVALAKKPNDRWSNTGEFATNLARAFHGESIQRPRSHGPLPVPVIAAVAAIMAVGLIAALLRTLVDATGSMASSTSVADDSPTQHVAVSAVATAAKATVLPPPTPSGTLSVRPTAASNTQAPAASATSEPIAQTVATAPLPSAAPVASTAPLAVVPNTGCNSSLAGPISTSPAPGSVCGEAGCTFYWVYNSPLAADEYFQVQVEVGGSGARGLHPPTKDNHVPLAGVRNHFADQCGGSGQCVARWSVAVVKWSGGDPSQVVCTVTRSEWRDLNL